MFSQRGAYLVSPVHGYRMQAFGQYADDETASTMKQRDYKDATDLVVAANDNPVFGIPGNWIGRNSDQENAVYCLNPDQPQVWRIYRTQGLAPTLQSGEGRGNAIFETYGIPGNWIGRKPENGGNAVEPMNNISPCQTKTDRHAVAVTEIAGTLTLGFCARGVDADQIANGNCAINKGNVRRLTPIECERLQGFPDNHTQIPYRNKSAELCPDGPRYAACGNSMAVPVMKWIGERIQEVCGGAA